MEKQTFIEVLKANKTAIFKKALIIGGTVAGLAIVMLGVQKMTGGDEDGDMDADEEQENEEVPDANTEA
jgi:hypothetical protein